MVLDLVDAKQAGIMPSPQYARYPMRTDTPYSLAWDMDFFFRGVKSNQRILHPMRVLIKRDLGGTSIGSNFGRPLLGRVGGTRAKK